MEGKIGQGAHAFLVNPHVDQEHRTPNVTPVVYGLGKSAGVFPTEAHAADIVSGLTSNWTYVDRGKQRIAYAHPERLEPDAWTKPEGSVGKHLASGKMRLVALQSEEGKVLASALLIRNEALGNVEIGSVQSSVQSQVKGMGRELMTKVFKETQGDPIVFLDRGTVRTPMEGSPRAVAMPHSDSEGFDPRDARIVSPTYIIGNQFGDEVTRWGSNGDFAFSVSHIEKHGPFRIPRLDRRDSIADGAEDVINKVTGLANGEGGRHEITVFGSRIPVPADMKHFDPYQLTEQTLVVDYLDTNTRRMAAGFGRVVTGVEFGVNPENRLIVGLHYSAMVPPEVSEGPKRELTAGYHPIHTTIAQTAELANFVRERMMR